MLQTLFTLLCVQYIFFWFYQKVQFEAKNMLERSRITSSVGLYMENATDIIFSIVCETFFFKDVERVFKTKMVLTYSLIILLYIYIFVIFIVFACSSVH